MNQPWDIRPGARWADRDPKELFAAIGEALTEWENVEAALASLFAVFVSARKNASFWSPAIQAYGSIASFKSRCDMIRIAADAYFSTRKSITDTKKHFKELLDLAGNYSARRNEIAHGKVSEVFWYDKRKRAKSHGFYLLPSLFNPRKNKKATGMVYYYVSGDLIHYRQEFTKLYLRLEGFRRALTTRQAALLKANK
jgi:hypothetical protein